MYLDANITTVIVHFYDLQIILFVLEQFLHMQFNFICMINA
jgi:hypothetical protein